MKKDEEKQKPYVVILHKDDPKKRFALNRNYVLMKNPDIDSCMLKDYVQICEGVTASFTYPSWFKAEEGDSYITIWFNYFD